MRLLALLLLTLFTSACAEQPPADQHTGPQPPQGGSWADPRTVGDTQLNYQPDPATFANPERGFHRNFWLATDTVLRVEPDITLVRSYVRLDDYRHTELPDSLLNDLQRGFDVVRSSGVKVIPRFTYNFGADPDAPLDSVLRHIEQLTPVLRANADVIAVLQAGFIGRWGEWHNSTNNLTDPGNKRIIGEALLEAMPEQRMVQIRAPFHMRDVLELDFDWGEDNPDVLFPPALAFREQDRARIGFVNDCFLSGTDDVGTFPTGLDSALAQAMAFYTVTGGETCAHAEAGGRQECPNAVYELALYQWDYLNLEFHGDVIDRWRADGCFTEIEKRLGYRFELQQSHISTAGQQIQLNLRLHNSGFGKLYNPRPLELVFVSRSGQHAPVTIQLVHDARTVLPLAGDTVDLNYTVTPYLPPGDWELQLSLPDAAPALRGRPEYSIRLASLDAAGQPLWLAATGTNRLGFVLQVPVD